MISQLALHKLRYAKPLQSLGENALIKGVFSVIALVISSVGGLIETVEGMFRTPIELVLLLLISIVVDWLTGLKYAKNNGININSLGLRQTWVKILEYTAGLIILTGIANVFGANNLSGGWVGEALTYLKNIHWIGYFYAIFTEFKSVSENTMGKEGRFNKIIKMINDKFFDEEDQK